jgi:integrase
MRSIGRHGSPWTPDTARGEALRLLGTLATGTDPFAKSLSAETFGAEIEIYLERKRMALKPRSFTEAQRYLRQHALSLHHLKLGEIDRRTIAVVLGEIERTSGPSSRNRARAAFSAFFSWAVQEGLVDANPVTGTGKAEEAASRDRVLTQEELRKLWSCLGDDRFSDVVRLLLLTGQRRNEIGLLQWSEVDLGRKLIALPPTRTKNGRLHELPLSTQAMEILARQPRRNSSDLVFDFGDWHRSKAKLDARLNIAPWRLHDLRRTAATQMAELGVQPHHIEAVLNHLSGHKASVAGTYNRAKYSDEMRSALQRFADHLDQITA